MKKILKVGIVMFIALSIFVKVDPKAVGASIIDFEYTKLAGGVEPDNFDGIAITSDGGYVIVGSSSSSASGDIINQSNGQIDGLIAKYDSAGNLEYTKLTGGSSVDTFHCVVATNDGGYVAVGDSASSASGDITDTNTGGGDGLIAKYDSAGNLEYTKLIGGSDFDTFEGVTITSDGGYVAVGYSDSLTSGDIPDVNKGRRDGLIAKYDSAGNLEYTKLTGGSGYDYFEGISGTNDGGYVAVGYSSSSMSGDITDTSNGSDDGLIAKYDSAGNLEYTKLIGGSDFDNLFGGAATSDGGYVAVGFSSSSMSGDITDTSNGSDDGLIAKYDSAGNLEYTKLTGGSSYEYFEGISGTSDGGYVAVGDSGSSMSGDITDTNNGNGDGLIAKYDSAGNLEHTKLIGGSDSEYFEEAVGTNDGGYVAVGYSDSSSSGDITDTNNGGRDGLITKYRIINTPILNANGFNIGINSSLSDNEIISRSAASAEDGLGSNLTENIEVWDRSKLDLTQAGIYKVELRVEDGFGQEVIREIEITVEDENGGGEDKLPEVENVDKEDKLPETGNRNISLILMLLLGMVTFTKRVIR